MRAAIILALGLAACASSPPERHELRDGAPVRPAPVFVAPGYTPAGAGLPEYMPGPPEPVRVEPAPRPTRLLPQTPITRRAPGIWASDTGAESGEEWQRVLNIYLPLPEPIEEMADAWPTARCAAHINARLDMLGMLDRARALPTRALRACLAARLYRFCAQLEVDDLERLRSAGEMLVPNAERRMKAMLATATAFHERTCPKPPPAEIDNIATPIEARWNTVVIP